MPYIFVMNPMMLMIDVTFWSALLMIATSVLGIIGVSSGVMGYLICRSLWWERILMAGGGLMMIYPGAVTDLIGVGIIAVGVVSQAIRKRAGKAA